jgi:hypothetical protein
MTLMKTFPGCVISCLISFRSSGVVRGRRDSVEVPAMDVQDISGHQASCFPRKPTSFSETMNSCASRGIADYGRAQK